MKIYLAGSVPKGDKEAEVFDNWRKRYQGLLLAVFPDADFIDPYVREADESDPLLVAGFDCAHIKTADLVVVHAEEKLGAGTSQELVVAKYFHRPVITVLPKDSHHRRSNITFHDVFIKDWTHPFIHTFSDFIVERVEDIGKIAPKLATAHVKDIGIIDEAIEYAERKLKAS